MKLHNSCPASSVHRSTVVLECSPEDKTKTSRGALPSTVSATLLMGRKCEQFSTEMDKEKAAEVLGHGKVSRLTLLTEFDGCK